MKKHVLKKRIFGEKKTPLEKKNFGQKKPFKNQTFFFFQENTTKHGKNITPLQKSKPLPLKRPKPFQTK